MLRFFVIDLSHVPLILKYNHRNTMAMESESLFNHINIYSTKILRIILSPDLLNFQLHSRSTFLPRPSDLLHLNRPS